MTAHIKQWASHLHCNLAVTWGHDFSAGYRCTQQFEDVESPKPLNQPRVDIWHSPTYCQVSGYITGKHAVSSLWQTWCCSWCLWVRVCNGKSLILTLLFHSEWWNMPANRAFRSKVLSLPEGLPNLFRKLTFFTLKLFHMFFHVCQTLQTSICQKCVLRMSMTVKWKVN